MENTEILSLVFTTIQMTQCISIGVFLIVTQKRRDNNISLFGIFLFVVGISFLLEMLMFFDIALQFPALELVVYGLFYLHSSLFYLYINSLIIQGKKQYNKVFLVLGLTLFSFSLPLLFFSSTIQVKGMEHWFFQIYSFASAIYLITIYIISIVQILRHNRKLQDQYSDTSQREIKWILYFSVFIITSFFIFIPITILWENSTIQFDLIATIISTIWVLGMAYNGLFYQNSKNLFNSPVTENLPDNTTKKKEEHPSKQSNTKKTSNTALFETIDTVVKNEQLFLNPTLTVLDVSNQVNKHPKLVSQTINSALGQNFNTYINQQRVNHAKQLLVNTNNNHLTIEGIGTMAGFKSASAFYYAFKKELNCTPSQYKKTVLSKI